MEKNYYPHIFSPIKVRNTVLKNRILRTPSMPHFHQGPQKYYTDALIAHYANTAKSGAAIVTASGARTYQQTGITGRFTQCDIHIPSIQNTFAQMADAIHLYGARAGMLMPPSVREGYDVTEGIENFVTAGDGTFLNDNKMMPASMVEDVAEEYIENAVLLKSCGFDMVWIHGTYQQFFPARFLSPMLNHRDDEYGGCLENRARLALTILKGIKERCGNNFLIEYSITPEEYAGGMTMDETVAFLELAKDYIDIVHPRTPDIESWFVLGLDCAPGTTRRNLAAELKKRIRHTGILVEAASGFLDPDICEDVLSKEEADFIGIGRGWLCNPDWLRLVADGRKDDIIPCIMCHKCHVNTSTGPFLSMCSVNPHLGYDNKESWLIDPVQKKRKVAVVGGGAAGLRAAMYLTDRGHNVTVFEKTGVLGGTLINASKPSFKWPLKEYLDWLIYQVGKRNIKIEYHADVTKESLESQEFEEVILAIGAVPAVPERIKGIKNSNVFQAADIYGKEAELGRNIVIIGGGEIGVETGMYLTETGEHQVTILEMRNELAMDATPVHYRIHLENKYKAIDQFSWITNATCREITSNSVIYTDVEGNCHEIQADSIILAVGMEARSEEVMKLAGGKYRTQIIGDCDKPSNVQYATRSAFGAAMSVL